MNRVSVSGRLFAVCRFASVVTVALFGILRLTVSGQAPGSPFELVSGTAAGVPAGGQTFIDFLGNDYGPSHLSADDRFVVFASPSGAIVPGDTNNRQDVFVRDRQTGTTTLISRAADGSQSNGDSGTPVISANGRFVAFSSLATNLVAGDTNDWSDVFLKDLNTGVLALVSVATGGGQAATGGVEPAISADGRYVVFSSQSNDLISNDTNRLNSDIFMRDTVAGTTTRVSVRPDGSEILWANSTSPSISADGRRIAFQVTNDVRSGPQPSGLPNLHHGIWVRDLDAGNTVLVSTRPDGSPAERLYSTDPMISANGRFVSFTSFEDLDPLFPDEADEIDGPYPDIFVRDLQSNVTTRASLSYPGGPAEESGNRSTISGDGRFVAYIANDNGLRVRDRLTNTTIAVPAPGSGPLDPYFDSPSVSEDGTLVWFESTNSNLVPNDTNALNDTFLFHLTPTADLSLTLAASVTQPAANSDVTLTVTVANAGPSGADGVAARMPLPSGLTFVSSTGTGTYNSATGGWTIGTIAAGSNASIQVVATFNATASVAVTAEVTASSLGDPDSTPGNHSATEDDQKTVTLTPTIADLSLALSVNTAVPPVNSNVTFTVSVANAGPGAATGVAATLPLPSALTFVSANSGAYSGATGVWTIGSLASGGTTSVQIVARVTATAPLDLTAQVIAATESDPDSTPNNNNPAEDDQDSEHLTPAASVGIIVNDATGAVSATDGKCTLIEAIIAANTDLPSGNAIGECAGGSGADTIRLQALNPPYLYAVAHNNTDGPNALPPIDSDITIQAEGNTIARAPGAGVPAFRLFLITARGRLTLNDATITNGNLTGLPAGQNTGGALFNEGTLDLNHSAVLSNAAGCDGGGITSVGPLTIRNNSSIWANTAGCSGGGIESFYAGALTISDSTILENKAPSGSAGGVMIHGTTTATITNTIFDSNTAKLDGGAILTHNNDANLTMSGGRVTNNVVTAGHGGGIANGRLDAFGTPFVSGGTMNLNGITIANNRSSGGVGGGVVNVGRLIATAVTLSDNQALNSCGGGLYNSGDATLALTTVTRNAAVGGGGGLCSIGFGPITVTDSVISSNSTVSQGGGVALYFSPAATFVNTTIFANSASFAGGGVYSLASLATQTVRLDNAVIQQNSTSSSGGGMSVQGGTTSLVNNTRVVSNGAAGGGGGIGIVYGGDCCPATVTMTGGVIDGNTASGDFATFGGGGGIAHNDLAPGSALTLNDVSVTNNHAPAADGGGVFTRGRLFVNGGTISNNDALSGGAVASGTSALSGGAATLTGVTLENNVVTSLGGALFVANPPAAVLPTVVIDGGTLRNNRAASGGAAYLRVNGRLAIRSGSIAGNSATGIGGAIYNEGIVAVDKTTLSANTADVAGAIYSSGPATVSASTIAGNTARAAAGAFVTDGISEFTTTTLSGNVATLDGAGAIEIAGLGTARLRSSTIAANVGNGAIRNGASLQIQGTIVLGNRRPDNAISECTIAPGYIGTGVGTNLYGFDSTCFLTTNDNVFGLNRFVDPARAFSAVLGPLADNGGPTHTHALLPGSLAIDADGSCATATDQRGLPRSVDGDGNGSALCDVGAYEQQTPLAGPQAVVTSLSPGSVLAGSPNTVVTVTGNGFTAGSVVSFNGVPRATFAKRPTEVTFTIPAAELVSGVDLKTIDVTVQSPGTAPSSALPFTIRSARVSGLQTGIVLPGTSATASLPPTAGGQSGVVATLTNNGVAGSAATLTVATYSTNPVGGTIFAAGGFFDVQVTGADASDSVAARFYYPTGLATATESALQLQFWNGTGWAPVLGSASAAPDKNTTDNLDGTVSGGRFAVTLDNTSTPRLTDLGGTVFAIASGGADTTAPVTTASVSPTPNSSGWNRTNVTVTLSATDAGSRVAATEYSLNSDNRWKPYAGPIAIADQGINTLRYRSRDTAGNVEANRTLAIKIDKSAPILLVQALPAMVWQDNGKLVDVDVWTAMIDLFSGGDSFKLVSVTSNDPTTTADDIKGWSIGSADTHGQLRARKATHGPRVYTLTYEGTDRAGNKATATTAVIVGLF